MLVECWVVVLLGYGCRFLGDVSCNSFRIGLDGAMVFAAAVIEDRDITSIVLISPYLDGEGHRLDEVFAVPCGEGGLV